jgi:uncharacterized 2Fe-2S/4Fe-4S cluster protein (DUF4445 family)
MGRITVLPEGISGPLREGESLLSHLQRLGIPITVGCGGTGECGTCRVRVRSGAGALSPPTSPEKKWLNTTGERLACQAIISDENANIIIGTRETGAFSIIGEGTRAEFKKDPTISVKEVKGQRVVVRNEDVLGILKGHCTGIALDVGTTTLVIRWYDLEGGSIEPLATASILNPQGMFGDNVIDRVSFATASPEGQSRVEQVLADAIQTLISSGPATPENIYDIVVVGNTVMRDLLCGLPVRSLGQSPYESTHPGPVRVPAADRKILISPSGELYAPPVLGQFVGADMLAVLLAVGMHERKEVSMAIDIGTNTEIAIGNQDHIIVTSCASGPAFEGSGVKCGTGAVNGAIGQVRLMPDDSVSYSTIGNEPPVGICGSGLVDTLSELLEHGLMDGGGKFLGVRKRFYLAIDEKEPGNTIFLDEEDIDAIKLAKAAIFTGVQTLLAKWDMLPDHLSRVYLAGAFGTSIDPIHAERIGMIPPLPRDRVLQAGNAAIEGASMMLLSRLKRDEAEEIVAITEHISLENEPGFEDMFIEGLRFGPIERP